MVLALEDFWIARWVKTWLKLGNRKIPKVKNSKHGLEDIYRGGIVALHSHPGSYLAPSYNKDI